MWSLACIVLSCAVGFLLCLLLAALLVYRQIMQPIPPPPPPTPPLFTAASERSIRRSATNHQLAQLAATRHSTIVVGGGLGGLTSAALLAGAGSSGRETEVGGGGGKGGVLVLEAHDVVGGCTHVFKAGGGLEFDSGVHYVGGEVWRQGSVFRLLLDVLTGGQVQWQPLHTGEHEWNDTGDQLTTSTPPNGAASTAGELDYVYDELHFGDRMVRVRAGTRRYTDDLVALFPAEAAAIRGYVRLTQRIWTQAQAHFVLRALLPPWLYGRVGAWLLPCWHRYSRVTTAQHLASVTRCQPLIDLLAYTYFDYGSLPASSAFAAHAVAACYFHRGTAFPVGGASQIAKRAVATIEALGGRVVTRARVEEIVVHGGRAVGVRVRRAGTGHTHSVLIYADRVVSAVGAHATYLSLLSPDTRQLIPELRLAAAASRPPAALRQAATHFSLYFAFRGDPVALRLPRHNTFVFPASHIAQAGEAWAGQASGDRWVGDGDALHAVVGAVMIMFACRKDPTYRRRHPGVVTGQILCEANYEWVARFEREMQRRRGDHVTEPMYADGHAAAEEQADEGAAAGEHGERHDDMDGELSTASSTSPGYLAMKRKMTAHLLAHLYRRFPQLAALPPPHYTSLATPLTTAHYLHSPHGSSYALAHTPERFASPLTRPGGAVRGLWLAGTDVGLAGLEGAVLGGAFCAAVVDWRVGWRLLGRVLGPMLRGTGSSDDKRMIDDEPRQGGGSSGAAAEDEEEKDESEKEM